MNSKHVRYPPPCRRHSCVYNPAEGPVFQSSSFPGSSFPDPVPAGVGVWRSILESQFWRPSSGFLRGGQDFPLRDPAWHPPPLGELPAPKFGYLASSWRSCAPSWLILALLGLILSPSCSKMAPSWPNIAQHRAKMSQHGLQEHPQDPQKPIESNFLKVFCYLAFRAQDPKKWARCLPK